MTSKQKQLIELFHSAPIAKYFGMRLSYNEAANAIFTLLYNPNLNHALGGIHGGVYMTMLDNAGWFTSAAAHDDNIWVATSEMQVHLLEPARECTLTSIGSFIKKGKRQDICEMKLFDDHQKMIGHATGTFIQMPHVPLFSSK